MRRVTIGVDFGTATTKCCFREQGDRKPFFIVGYDAYGSHASRVLMPAAVAYRAGKLFFGFQAEGVDSAITIRSFKMCLLCQARAYKAEATEPATPHGCPSCLPRKPGYYQIDDFELSAEDLSTLYLAAVLKEVKTRVIDVLGGDRGELRWSANSAAPLDQMNEFGEVGEHFERTLYYAWGLADVSQNPWRVENALAALQQVRKEPRPSLEMSPTRVFPETHAAMTAYLLLPQTERGLYGSVDIGAGTTDVAFFWLQKDEEDTKAWYYAAGSKRIGMDDVDQALASVLQPTDGNLRAAREALAGEDLRACRGQVEPVAKRIYQHQAGVLHDAMKVDQRPRAWFERNSEAQYRLFLVGGGSACELITEKLRTAPPRHEAHWQVPPCSLSIPGATKVALPGGESASLQELDEPVAERLCLLAYGLSHPRPDIPKYERDAEGVHVEVKVREPPPDKTGQWW